MPARRRHREAVRAAARAAKRPDLAGWTVPLVGRVVQTEATWEEYERTHAPEPPEPWQGEGLTSPQHPV